MKKKKFYILIFLLIINFCYVNIKFSPASNKKIILKTSGVSVEFNNGLQASFKNLLTNESIDVNSKKQSSRLLWMNKQVEMNAGTITGILQKMNSIETSLSQGKDTMFKTIYKTDDTGDLIIQQSGQSSEYGLYGAQWGISSIPDDLVNVIVPYNSGYAFDMKSPDFERYLDWPTYWEAGMVLLQMKNGGFLIWADDPKMHFKRLSLIHTKKKFHLGFQTHNFAPFEECNSINTMEWHITPYKGDWRVGAGIYKKWMEKNYDLTLLDKQKPSWVKDMKFVVIMDIDTKVLDDLAKWVVPAHTLLNVWTWRVHGVDDFFPDYTPVKEFKSFVEYAHKLGYKVMPLVNYFGCDTKHPLYEKFKQFQLCDPFNKQLQGWVFGHDWKVNNDFYWIYVHPGSREWRKLLISNIKKAYDECKFDAIYLDQTLLVYNHAYGFVDGVNAIEGNMLLQKELMKAMPGIAISGEGLNEITIPYESFAQRHAFDAVDNINKKWDEDFVKSTHPISSFLFLPYNTMYGYLLMSDPSSGNYYYACKRSYENYGIIPTISILTSQQLKERLKYPDGELKMFLEEASLWTKEKPVPDFTGDWLFPVKFRFKTENDQKIVIQKNENNGSDYYIESDNKKTLYYSFFTGLNQKEGKGYIDNWIAYNDNKIMGLNTDNFYCYINSAADFSLPHISYLPENIFIKDYSSDNVRLFVDLHGMNKNKKRVNEAIELTSPKKIGCVINSEKNKIINQTLNEKGKYVYSYEIPIPSKTAFFYEPVVIQKVDYPVNLTTIPFTLSAKVFGKPAALPMQWVYTVPGYGIAGVDKQYGLQAGPPNNGRVYANFLIDLPKADKVILSFAIAIEDGSRSSGCRFIIEGNFKEIFNKLVERADGWHKYKIDVTAFTGDTLLLSLAVDSEGVWDYDFARWAEPVITVTKK